MEARLLFEAPSAVKELYGQSYSLDSPEVTLGRDPTRDIQVPPVFSDVSRGHCSFCRQNGSLSLKDYSSRGSFLNGERVIPNVYVHLRDGDRLTFGGHLKARVVIRKGLRGMLKSLFD
jgi:predicted component of type VI protein secretion system